MFGVDVSFLNDIFGTILPALPMAVLIVGALLIPGLFFLTKRRTVCAAFAMIAILLSGAIVGLSILDD